MKTQIRNFSQINVLNPRQHEEEATKRKLLKHQEDINFKKENKKMIKQIQEDIKLNQIQDETNKKHQDEADNFKMSKFKGIPSKVGPLCHLEQGQEKENQNLEKLIEQKYYIKRNMTKVREINKCTQENLKQIDSHKIAEEKKKPHTPGQIPKYLQTIKFQQKKDQDEILHEIEANKRPQGTRLVEEVERKEMLRKLFNEQKELQKEIKKMSVTLYTVRAQNQLKGFVERLNEVDQSIVIFSRKKCFVKQ